VSTERIVDAAADMLETWAKHLDESARLCYQSMRDGDPDGHGIEFLRGKAAAYWDVSKALQASADDVRGRVQPVEKPRLRAVPSTSKERDH
jgi:catechol-2,3-dioxygenase